jgi:hypothetical protein
MRVSLGAIRVKTFQVFSIRSDLWVMDASLELASSCNYFIPKS